MIEGLVLYACLVNKGCSEAGSTYYATHESLRKYIERNEQDVKRLLSPYVMEYVLPSIAFASGANYAIRVSDNMTMNLNKEQVRITFKREW